MWFLFSISFVLHYYTVLLSRYKRTDELCAYWYMLITPRVILVCCCFTSLRRVWTGPARDRMKWTSEEQAWLASVLQRCAAGLSPAQPALFIVQALTSVELQDHEMTTIKLYTLRCIRFKREHRWYTTLFGLLNEFSSITLLDVRTVAVDPSALTLAWSPFAETLRLTASDPKFTICTRAFKINGTSL